MKMKFNHRQGDGVNLDRRMGMFVVQVYQISVDCGIFVI